MGASVVKLIVGLGNPGASYAATRHNVGFRVVDELARRAGASLDQDRYQGHFAIARLEASPVALLKPRTSMNHSGRAVREALSGLEIQQPELDLLVVIDDLDLPLGRLRVRAQGSDGGQRGLRDVIDEIGTSSLARLRFGVSRPPAGVDPIAWVLDAFADGEQSALERSITRAADASACWLAEGVAAAMDRFNGPPEDTR